jgi:hypothetical protein
VLNETSKLFLGALLLVTVMVSGLSLLSNDVLKFETRIYASAVCSFGSRASCKDLFYKYSKSAADVQLAESTGRGLCLSAKKPDIAICTLLAPIEERMNRWPEAISAHGVTCDAGNPDQCLAQLVLMGKFSAPADALARAEELCQKELPTACYWSGIIGWKMKDKPSEQWGFQQGCFKYSMPESCLSLGEYYTEQKQNQHALNAFIEGCSLSLEKSCARAKSIQDTIAMNADLLAHIHEHRVIREQLKQVLNALAKGSGNKAEIARKLDNFRGRLLVIDTGYRNLPEKVVTEMALRNLFAKELSVELSTIDDVQNVLHHNGSLKELSRFVQKPVVAQREAETAYGRLPASHLGQ